MYSVVLMMALSGGTEAVEFGRHRGGCSGSGSGCSGYVSSGCSGSYGGCSGVSYGSGYGGCSGSSYGGGYGGCSGVSYGGGCSGSSYGGCSGSCSGGRGGFIGGGGLLGGRHRHGGGCSGSSCYGSYGSSYGGCTGSSYGSSFGSGYGCTGGSIYGGGCYGSSAPVYGVSGGIIAPGMTGPGGAPMQLQPPTPGTAPSVPTPPTKPNPDTKKINDISAPATLIVTLPAEARLFVDGNATTSTSNVRTLITPALDTNADYVLNLRAELLRDGQTVTQNRTVSVRGGQTAPVSFSFAAEGVASR